VSELPVSMGHGGAISGVCLLTPGTAPWWSTPTGAAGREERMSSSDEHLYRGDPPTAAPQFGPPPPGAPGYGPPPGYPPAGYGPPGYAPQGYPPAAWGRPTNTVAILALVMAFVFAPAGVVLGIIARKQIRRTGEDGAGLALAGIIVGGIATALFVLMFVALIVAFSAASSYSYGP
jgi:hypothetical protein